jgi:DNA-directed RNA polymerase specialized sigma24 family protein
LKLKRREGDDMDIDFEQLYNTYYMKVYSFVMTLAKNRDIAEEITQKSFFKAMTANKKYRGGSSELTWYVLYRKKSIYR